MFAIIETGGKQYVATPTKKIEVEKLAGVAADSVTFERVLLVAEEDGSSVTIGTPTVSRRVMSTITAQKRDRKIMVRKFKNKVRYRRTAGHRQHHTQLTVNEIQ